MCENFSGWNNFTQHNAMYILAKEFTQSEGLSDTLIAYTVQQCEGDALRFPNHNSTPSQTVMVK